MSIKKKTVIKKTVKNYFEIKLPSRSVNEGFARAAVAAFAAQLDPSVEIISELKTAVSEAVTNAVVHAYPDGIGIIHIKCRIYDDNSIAVAVRDMGVGISDIKKAREPLFTSGSEDRAGMGFTVMEALSDKITVRSRPGRGTTVTIFKKIDSRDNGQKH